MFFASIADAISNDDMDVRYSDITEENRKSFFVGEYEDASESVKRMFLLLYGSIPRKHIKVKGFQDMDEEDLTLAKFFHFFPCSIEAFTLQVVELQMAHCRGDKSAKHKRGKQKKQEKAYMGDHQVGLVKMQREVMCRRTAVMGVKMNNVGRRLSLASSTSTSTASTTESEGNSLSLGEKESNLECAKNQKSWYNAVLAFHCQKNKEFKQQAEEPACLSKENLYLCFEDEEMNQLLDYCDGEKEWDVVSDEGLGEKASL